VSWSVSEFDALCANDAELAQLRTSIREFLAADRTEFGWQPAVDCWLANWDPDFSGRLANAGFVGLTVPTEYGGRGLGYLHRYVVTEELLAHGAPVAAQTRATRADDGWLLNGSKVWTSGAHVAHQIVVLARTSPLDPQHRHAGFSQFVVQTSAPGITISPIVLMNGEHHFNEVIFSDVFIPDTDVLGQIGDGWHQVTAELGFERSGPERILSTATLIFSVIRALGDVDDGVAADVGDLVARMISLRQLSISVARTLADGQNAASRAALVKDLGTRFEQDSVELVADLLDYVEDAEPLRALLATARVHSPLFTLRGGTNEVLRGVVAKGMGAAPR
jgi:alkylation response protein AidB-like acyl-CoA dehydrogenase